MKEKTKCYRDNQMALKSEDVCQGCSSGYHLNKTVPKNYARQFSKILNLEATESSRNRI